MCPHQKGIETKFELVPENDSDTTTDVQVIEQIAVTDRLSFPGLHSIPTTLKVVTRLDRVLRVTVSALRSFGGRGLRCAPKGDSKLVVAAIKIPLRSVFSTKVRHVRFQSGFDTVARCGHHPPYNALSTTCSEMGAHRLAMSHRLTLLACFAFHDDRKPLGIPGS